MMLIKATISALAILFLITCTGQVDDNPHLTIYVSADEQVAREVFAAFTKKTQIKVLWVGDTEASKTTALVNRLRLEKDLPVADVFWSSEILGMIQLANENILASHHSSVADSWPLQHRDVSNRWFGFSPRARVIAYDPARVQESSLPEYWWSYGEAAMADPRFGTTGTHLAVMASFDDRFSVFVDSLQGERFLGGNAATLQAVIDGTVALAMTDTDDVHAAIARGASVAMHFPRHHDGAGGGTLLIPNTVGMIQGCDHPGSAAAFVDFMLSDEVAILLARSTSHNIPLQPSVASQFPELQVHDPLEADFYKAATDHTEIIPIVMDRLSRAEN